MKIKLSDLGEETLRVLLSEEPNWLVNAPDLLSGEVGTSICSRYEIELYLSKLLSEVHVKGSISFSVVSTCARCLNPVESDLRPEINLSLMPVQSDIGKDDSADYESYDGNEIDLTGYIREVIAMSIPVKVLCSEGCLGLCKNCGINLNSAKCSCADGWIEPKFAALRKVKL